MAIQTQGEIEKGGMRETERVCVCLSLTEMKHLEGQRSSHPEPSPRAHGLGSLERSDKQTGVCSPPVNDWLNKWTGSLWCRAFRQKLTHAHTHTHTNAYKDKQEDDWYLNISQDNSGGLSFKTHTADTTWWSFHTHLGMH